MSTALTTLADIAEGEEFVIITDNHRGHWVMGANGAASPRGQSFDIPDIGFFLDGLLHSGSVYRRDATPPEAGEWWTYRHHYNVLVLGVSGDTCRTAWFSATGLLSSCRDVDDLGHEGVRREPVALDGEHLLYLMQNYDSMQTRVNTLSDQVRQMGNLRHAVERISQMANAVLT
jgi:hypothetical protein